MKKIPVFFCLEQLIINLLKIYKIKCYNFMALERRIVT